MTDRIELRVNGAVVYESGSPPAVVTDEEFLRGMYLKYENREPDPGGFAWWLNQMRGGMSREEVDRRFAPRPPQPPPPPPPPVSGGGEDISNQDMLPFIVSDGEVKRFSWRQSFQSSEQLTVIQVAAGAKTGWWSIDGAPWQSFTPTGSDFRFIPIDNVHVAAGTHTIDVKITGIAGGSGRFGIQNVGAGVGP